MLWGLGGTLVSGAREALLYDGLAAVGAQQQYARINGWVTAAELIGQLPAAVAATAGFAAGGFPLVGWVSVGVCLAAAAAATRLPEPARSRGDELDDGLGYLATLRAGLALAAAQPGVRAAVVAAALLGAFDVVEEYFPLILADRGVPVALVPVAGLPIVAAGAVGAATGGCTDRLRPATLGLLLGGAMLLLGTAGTVRYPTGLAALALFYGGYRAVLVVVDARLQGRLESRSRATVTSVAGLGTDLSAFALYAAWAVGEVPLLALLGMLTAAAVPRLLRARVRR